MISVARTAFGQAAMPGEQGAQSSSSGGGGQPPTMSFNATRGAVSVPPPTEEAVAAIASAAELVGAAAERAAAANTALQATALRILDNDELRAGHVRAERLDDYRTALQYAAWSARPRAPPGLVLASAAAASSAQGVGVAPNEFGLPNLPTRRTRAAERSPSHEGSGSEAGERSGERSEPAKRARLG